MTIYIDIVLIENLIMNYIILFTTAVVLKIKVNHIRLILASLLGAGYSIIAYMGIIKVYSEKLTADLGTKYDASTLNKMKKFYNLIKKMATVSPKLSYSHYVELLPYSDIDKINYYIKITEEEKLSVRELREKIKNNEYERLDGETKKKLKKCSLDIF